VRNKIWCVFNPNGRAPTFAHPSEASAKEEAKRLAKNNPDHKFYVMESIGCAEKIDVFYYATPKDMEFEDGIPF